MTLRENAGGKACRIQERRPTQFGAPLADAVPPCDLPPVDEQKAKAQDFQPWTRGASV